MNSLFVSGGVNTAMAFYFFESQKSKVNTVHCPKFYNYIYFSRELKEFGNSRCITSPHSEYQ